MYGCANQLSDGIHPKNKVSELGSLVELDASTLC